MPMRLLPPAVLDLGYRLFARFRYDLFGKYDSCRVPSESERARFFS
jgi:predicted DCC family thiol-disulfide oxidoreductase YuxK